jgi:hypothetical protein
VEKMIMKLVRNKKLLYALAFSALFLPCTTLASSVYVDTSHPDFFVGDTILFSVRVDSENKDVNVVEGSVLLDYPAGSVSLVGINVSGSKFPLWPGKPFPLENNTGISFAGGSPGGLNSKDAVVFNFVLKLQEAGKVTLTPSNLSVYLHDGKGTKDVATAKSLVIDVLPKKGDMQLVDDLSKLTSSDTTPPEPFEISSGQVSSVFDGKRFLSFNAVDTQSGISHYEVTEAGLLPVRSSDTYVLQEQNKSVQVKILAYDLAGNKRESTYSYTYSPTSIPVSAPSVIGYVVLVLVLISVVAFVLYKKRKKNDLAQK